MKSRGDAILIKQGQHLKVKGLMTKWIDCYARESFDPHTSVRFPLMIVKDKYSYVDFDPIASDIQIKFITYNGDEILLKV